MRIIKNSDWSSANNCIYIPNDAIRFDSIRQVSLETTENALCLNISAKNEDYKLLASRDDEDNIKKMGQAIAGESKIVFRVYEDALADEDRVESEVPKMEKTAADFRSPEAEAQSVYKINSKKVNPVAKRLRELGGKFEYWAESAYRWILGVTIVECIAAFIIGAAFLADGDGEILLYMLPCIAAWLVLGYLNANFVRFILRCISVDYLGKSEVVQNTYESAVAATEKK